MLEVEERVSIISYLDPKAAVYRAYYGALLDKYFSECAACVCPYHCLLDVCYNVEMKHHDGLFAKYDDPKYDAPAQQTMEEATHNSSAKKNGWIR